MRKAHSTPKLGKVIKIDEAQVQEHLGEVVRGTVEETLNAMLDAEAVSVTMRARERAPTTGRGELRRGGEWPSTIEVEI